MTSGNHIFDKKEVLEYNLDKKVINVGKDITATGGTALDVMKNVPSVNVDIDGNLTLRNQPPLLYIDGRPTTLTLDQIPADAIESVEVITNRSPQLPDVRCIAWLDGACCIDRSRFSAHGTCDGGNGGIDND